MNDSLLSRLDLHSDDVPHLPPRVRNRLLNFLVRWEAYQEALHCLDAIGETGLVSLADLRADALEGLGRTGDALEVRQERLAQKDSLTARLKLGHSYLAAGHLAEAQAIAEALGDDQTSAYFWSFIGDLSLQRGDLAAAEAAYLRHESLSPNSRQPLYGLARLYLARGDSVTAAAYAVRAYIVQEEQHLPSIGLLRQIRTFFAELGDPNHLAVIDEQLAARFEEEYTEMEALVAGEVVAPRSVPRARSQTEAPPPSPVVAPLPDLAAIPVSDAERAELEDAVRRYFNFPSLLAAQLEIMACARRGEHVLAVLPTGGGKSLCYQLPALLDHGLTLVVSPLIALMKDQVDSLPPAARQHALAINSTLDGNELLAAIDAVGQGRYKLVYAAPERLRQPPFLHALRQAGLSRLVIDEAHCISVWGHDFRPDYLDIAKSHRALGSPPVLAMTATAPPRVREDIERRLFGRRQRDGAAPSDFRLIATDTYRPNLTLSVIEADNNDAKLRYLVNLCQALEGSGIIYAGTRRRCEELAALLRKQGINAEHYHAGLTDRAIVQDRFMSGQTEVIVATVAFGMGVDKADIRYIIHYGLPDSVEAYYQEAGRAGRDGQLAHCILLYSSSDIATRRRHARESLIAVEFLRQLYGAVRRRLNGRQVGTIAMDDLARDMQSDDTSVRVALSTLEQARLLARHHDAPRTVSLKRLTQAKDEAFDAFAEAARLRVGQEVTRNFADLAAVTVVAATELEAQLLEWETAGYLSYQPNGRDCLLTLPPPPDDAATRIDSLLSQYNAIQQQRVAEIVNYARTHHCRHGFLSNYLGGQPRGRCQSCDNCLDESPLPDFEEKLMPEAEQARLVLTGLSQTSWGRRSLIAILRGEPEMAHRVKDNAVFGKLAFRSETALDHLISRLIRMGHVAEKQLGHGGIALELTASGQNILSGKQELEIRPRPQKKRSQPKEAQHDSDAAPDLTPDEEALYEQLVFWRRQRAAEDSVPAYIVAYNETLEVIARQRPRTERDLLKVKGVGPAKMDKYGAEILAIVNGQDQQ